MYFATCFLPYKYFLFCVTKLKRLFVTELYPLKSQASVRKKNVACDKVQSLSLVSVFKPKKTTKHCSYYPIIIKVVFRALRN